MNHTRKVTVEGLTDTAKRTSLNAEGRRQSSGTHDAGSRRAAWEDSLSMRRYERAKVKMHLQKGRIRMLRQRMRVIVNRRLQLAVLSG